MARLSERHKRFAEEYLIDLNATQAAIRAGYSAASASTLGERALKNVDVRAHIDRALAERSKRTGINQDRVLAELAKVALYNAADVIGLNNAVVLSGADRDDTAAISSVKVKVSANGDVEREVRLADKLKALELLGKHIGMFPNDNKLQLVGALPVQIIDDVPREQ